MPVDVSEMRAWTVQDSTELYNIEAWGDGYFRINEQGHVVVTPRKGDTPALDLKSLVDDLIRRGVRMPVVIRFSDILADRVRRIADAFQHARVTFEYSGTYQGVYPIKVNQERLVVEELVRFGAEYGLGLEAGSKPELLIAMALQANPRGLIICNGYKDAEYMELALMAHKLGRRAIIVIDRFEEVELLLQLTRRLDVRPVIGVRTRLNARGAGPWSETTGDRSKFGLTLPELVRLVDTLREADMLDGLQMLHFHIGSQITAIRAIKNALSEGARIFIELYRLGAPLRYLDVGGGLAVDYDGSQTNFRSSSNYTLQEYAADVVSAVGDACQSAGVPSPTLISESGRSLTAHHSVLVFDVLGVSKKTVSNPPTIEEDDHAILVDLQDCCRGLTRKNFQETYHDLLQLREEAQTLFNVGVFDLAQRAKAERLFWHGCSHINELCQTAQRVPKELRRLRRALADLYYCNFSVFQSVPDHWACKQLFPTLPVHRLDERPSRCATLADLTCDSDGKVDQFIDLHNVKDVLELHELQGDEPYYIGMFLVGAYQEILGDLHNLFGDTHCMHISLADEGCGYRINEFEKGERIQDVLKAVSYSRRSMINAMRLLTEEAVAAERLSFEEAAQLLAKYEKSMDAYTYLTAADQE